VSGSVDAGVHGGRVKPIVQVERGHTVSCCGRVFVSELGHWQQVYRIVLILADERPEVGFDCLVKPLGLSIGLRMKRRDHAGADA